MGGVGWIRPFTGALYKVGCIEEDGWGPPYSHVPLPSQLVSNNLSSMVMVPCGDKFHVCFIRPLFFNTV